MFLGDNLVLWSLKWQNGISRSSVEAEYCIVANGVVKACTLWQLLLELHSLLSRTTLIYYNNISVIYISTNLV
jgi:hypothetical protein